MAASSSAHAQSADCTLTTTNPSPLLNGSAALSVTINNNDSGDVTGMAPGVELYLPPGLTLSAATLAGDGGNIKITDVGEVAFPVAEDFVNPLTEEAFQQLPDAADHALVGYRYYYLNIPISSLATSAPALEVDLTVKLGEGAEIGQGLNVQSVCGFAYGADALNNPTTDPPVFATSADTVTLTPSVVQLQNSVSPEQDVAGQDVTYTITLDVAEGVSMNGFTLTDVIDEDFTVTSATATFGTVSWDDTTPGADVPLDVPAFIGAAGTDLTLTITGHVERTAFENQANPVATGIQNTAMAEGMSYNTTDDEGSPTVASLGDLSEGADFITNALLVNQTASSSNTNPGDDVRMTVTVNASRYFSFTGVYLNATAPDGSTVQSGSLSPATGTTTDNSDDTTTVSWFVGNLSAGASASAEYTVHLDQEYANGATVYADAPMNFSSEAGGLVDVAGGSMLMSSFDSGGARTGSFEISAVSFSKTIVAINGSPVDPNAALSVEAGNSVTFKLVANVPSGDLQDLSLTDYLPPPLFDATQHSAFASGEIEFGGDNTAPVSASEVSITTNSAENYVRFGFPVMTTTSDGGFVVDLRVTYTVGNKPTEDDVGYTNLLVAEYQGASSATGMSMAVFVMHAPDLEITRGATASGGNGTLSAEPTTTYTSAGLAASPLTADVSGADAYDVVSFVIAVENKGHGMARDVRVTDALPTGMSFGSQVSVKDGTGADLTHSGTLGAGNLEIDSLPGVGGTDDGSNIALIRFTATVDVSATIQSTLEGTASLTHYASTDGGPNFATTALTDSSEVEIAGITLSQSSPVVNRPIGGIVHRQVVLTVPEGNNPELVFTDSLPNGWVYATGTAPVVKTSPGVSAGTEKAVEVRTQGTQVSFTGVRNENQDNAVADTVTLDYDVVVLNVTVNQAGRRPRAVTRVRPANLLPLQSLFGNRVTVVEPGVSISIDAGSDSLDASDSRTITVTLTAASDTNASTAYELTPLITWSGFGDVTNFETTDGVVLGTHSAGSLSASLASLAPGESASFSFDIPANSTVVSGSELRINGQVAWTSLSGTPAAASTYNTASVERTGADGVGTGLNNYAANATAATVTVASPSVAIVRTSPDNDVQVGDEVTYRITATIPEGASSGFAVEDDLPSGLVFVSASDFSASTNLQCGGGNCSLPADSDSSADVLWNFGDITNSDNDNSSAETLIWTVTARVANSAGVNGGSSWTNQAQISGQEDSVDAAAVIVREPTMAVSLRVDDQSNVTDVEAGDLVPITVIVQAESETHATAYDVHLEVDIPDDLDLRNITDNTCSSAPSESDPVILNLGSVAAGASCRFVVNTVVADTAVVGVNMKVHNSLTWTSVAGDNPDERDGTKEPTTVNDYSRESIPALWLRMKRPTLALTRTSGAQATIGDLVTYSFTVTLPAGTSSKRQIIARLGNDLVYASSTDPVIGTGITCDGGPCWTDNSTTVENESGDTVTALAVDSGGHKVMWNFPDPIVNTDHDNPRSITLTVSAYVANTSGNQVGEERTISMEAAGGGANSNSQPVAIIEPDVEVEVEADDPTAHHDAGDTIDYTATLTASGGTAAHELALSITLPSGLENLKWVDRAGDCEGTTRNGATTTVSTLASGSSCTLHFSADLPDDATFGENLTVRADAAWSSMAGVQGTTSLSTYGAAFERTGVEADPGGSLNIYTDSDTAALTLAGQTGLFLEHNSSSEPTTLGMALTPGETFVFTSTVTLAEGNTPNVVLSITPPNGFSITAAEVSTAGFEGTFGRNPSSTDLGLAPNAAANLEFGNVEVLGNNDDSDNHFNVRITGVAGWVSTQRTNTDAPVSVRLLSNSVASASGSLAYTRALGFPLVSLAASSSTPGVEQDTTVTVTLRNAGDAPVCGSGFDVALPAALTAKATNNDGVDNDHDGEMDEADEAGLRSAERALSLSVPGCLAPGAARQLSFLATVEDGVPPEAVDITATVHDDYTTLATGGKTLHPADDEADNDGSGGSPDEEGDPIAELSITPDAPRLVFTKRDVDVNGALLKPGDTLRYDIVVKNTGTGPASSVIITDTLPLEHASVEGSASTTAGSVVLDAGTLTASLGDVAASATATVSVRLRLDNPLAHNTPVSNQASLAAGQGYGNRDSDDPDTVDANDATASIVDSENDRDGDGVDNDHDTTPDNADLCGDSDQDGCEDCRSGRYDPDNDGTDTDGDGRCDVGDSYPNDPDADDDGVLDGDEPLASEDTDGDGIPNWLDPDSDNDGLFDGTELGVDTATTGTDLTAGHFEPDTDTGSTTDPLNADSDGDGRTDGAEDLNHNGHVDSGETDPNVPDGATGSDPNDRDGDGLTNDEEAALGTDPDLFDTDGDGLSDAQEVALGTDPLDADSDDDGVPDGSEPDFRLDTDGDGLINALDPDSDNDGLFDGTEMGVDGPVENRDGTTATDVDAGSYVPDQDPSATTSPLNPDTDGDGRIDSAEDLNHNGHVDSGETDPNVPDTATGSDPDDRDGDGLTNDEEDALGTDPDLFDTDGDGLSDAQEVALGTDPLDADSDDDGVPDGSELDFGQDTDGDGLINALDPDSDNDGLFDGTEMGMDSPVENPDGTIATDVDAGSYVPDQDPSTTTSPMNPDTDGDGRIDSAEDLNHNGRVDSGETDPNVPDGATGSDSDDRDGDGLTNAEEDALGTDPDLFDTDGDGLSDAQEVALGTDPLDADSDDDGVPDGSELDFGQDTDGDGLINALDPDSDNDGLFDGTEMGVETAGTGTDVDAGNFVPDTDTDTTTSPVNPDTDGDGLKDGVEDANGNGHVDTGETDPNDPQTVDGTDDAATVDSDGDGLTDAQEAAIGTDPHDADSDDDGVPDGDEPNYQADTDGDGLINALDPDSDNDGLFDGTEMGVETAGSGTDVDAGNFVPDTDPGTTTSPLNPDTDGDGLKDGVEDANGNGHVDDGETDPNDPDSDDDGTADTATDDSDGDGLTDAQEAAIGTDPNDADSDDDGVPDGQEPNYQSDTDGDGLINALDPDSDNDGLFDGTEMGVATAGTGTDADAGHFVPDTDPGTTTSPVNADTDGDGRSDGAEDLNHNGHVDSGETDPNVPDGATGSDPNDRDGDGLTNDEEATLGTDPDLFDTDGDGLSDAQEVALGTDPLDADSDDDGVPDGSELDFGLDTDGDGLINALDSDSDNDGLFDGTEMGMDSPVENRDGTTATDVDAGSYVPDQDPSTTTSPVNPDTDGDGLTDGAEDANGNGRIDSGETDPNDPETTDGTPDADAEANKDTDGDGLTDVQEAAIGTDPNDADSDDDGVPDGQEPNPQSDSDGDGLINALDPDSDNDGIYDGTEMGKTEPVENSDGSAATDVGAGNFVPDADPSTTTEPLNPDTDGDGLADGVEDANRNGRIDSDETDPNDPDSDDDGNPDSATLDSDGDGLTDAQERAIGTDPDDADSDDDGVPDGEELNYQSDTDGDGLINALDPDSDNDGLFDGTEMGKDSPVTNRDGTQATDESAGNYVPDQDTTTTTEPLNPDTDGDGLTDGAEDANGNGAVDNGETDPNNPETTGGTPDTDAAVNVDSDGDGLTDIQEVEIGTDPHDADSDDDGVPDGQEPNARDDSDGDGLINALDPDSDNDGIYDGTEMGVTTPVPALDADNAGTDVGAGNFVPDADPDTTTKPLNPDTDGDGLADGVEDANRNGQIDAGETDPNNPQTVDGTDDAASVDTDGDGLTDAQERAIGTDPRDADSDDDGVPDGEELNYQSDSDGDGLINALDPDSDNDGLFDGTEMGKDSPVMNADGTQATNEAAGSYVPDADTGSTTEPLNPDTDGDGLMDGAEDANRNGAVDNGETDPNNPETTPGTPDANADANVDSDGDGLTDAQERAIGTKWDDADSDDDGVLDGDEPNYGADSDGDGTINALDPDSDDDGIFDGTELGVTVAGTDTSTTAGHYIPDADDGSTTTSPLLADTDGGGTADGLEDRNHNGAVDTGETDPNDASDDDLDGDRVLVGDDLDIDNDGIPNDQENTAGIDPVGDVDGDGVPNYRDQDNRGDGQPGCEASEATAGACDAIPALFDTDGDGVPNHEDLDSDGDGLADVWEVGHGDLDSDGDGTVDGPYGANGLADALETSADSGETLSRPQDLDSDGMPNFLDVDSDGDGAFDAVEAGGLPEGVQLSADGRVIGVDADHDGITDSVDADPEAWGYPNPAMDPSRDGAPDTDGDGIIDVYDAAGTAGYPGDSDGDGIPDSVECPDASDGCPDTDGDGVPDYMDADDVDGDGVPDDVDADVDGDGIANAEENVRGLDPEGDHDGDGVPNYLDADDRGDGEPADCTAVDRVCTSPSPLYDTDGDGTPNHRDLDSDGDGIWDAIEAGHGALDTDGDGKLDGPVGDNGLTDAVETGPESGETAARPDTDGDGLPDFLDVDSDGDNVLDRDERGPDGNAPRDTDGDGVPDYRDTDSDGDGVLDAVEAGDDDPLTPPIDSDGDGVPDVISLDSDGDGVADEADNCRTVVNLGQASAEGEIGDACAQGIDTDGDGVDNDVDNCPAVDNPDQQDSNGDGVGDLCPGGLKDDIQMYGCSQTGSVGGSLWSLALLLGLLVFNRRRR